MFPWIRLLRAGAMALRAGRVDVFTTTCIRMQVWPNDLDVNLHVNNGRYLALADVARIHWFLRTGAMKLALRERAMPVVGDAIAKFRRDLQPFQRFEIRTRMLGWDQRWGFLEHRFVREGRVIGVVGVRGLFKGPNGSVEPARFLSRLGPEVVSPPLPEWIARWSSGCDALSVLLREEEASRT